MNKAVKALLLLTCLSAGLTATTANWASNYAGSNDYTKYYQDSTCPKALSKVNQAISDLTDAVKDKNSTQWDVYAPIEKLQGLSYYVDNACNTSKLEVSNQNKSNQTDAQAKACQQYIDTIQSLLDQSSTGSGGNSDYQGNLDLSQQTLDLAGDLADSCQVELVDAEAQKEKEEEEAAAEAAANEAEVVGEEEWSAVEEDNNDVDDLSIKVVQEKDGKTDTYVIHYTPNDDGSSDLVIVHNEEDNVAPEKEEPIKEKPTRAQIRRHKEAKQQAREQAAEKRQQAREEAAEKKQQAREEAAEKAQQKKEAAREEAAQRAEELRQAAKEKSNKQAAESASEKRQAAKEKAEETQSPKEKVANRAEQLKQAAKEKVNERAAKRAEEKRQAARDEARKEAAAKRQAAREQAANQAEEKNQAAKERVASRPGAAARKAKNAKQNAPQLYTIIETDDNNNNNNGQFYTGYEKYINPAQWGPQGNNNNNNNKPTKKVTVTIGN